MRPPASVTCLYKQQQKQKDDSQMRDRVNSRDSGVSRNENIYTQCRRSDSCSKLHRAITPHNDVRRLSAPWSEIGHTTDASPTIPPQLPASMPRAAGCIGQSTTTHDGACRRSRAKNNDASPKMQHPQISGRRTDACNDAGWFLLRHRMPAERPRRRRRRSLLTGTAGIG